MLSRWLVVFGAGAVSAATYGIGACTSQSATAPTADAMTDDATMTEGICPGAAPQAGAECLLPEGTLCAFGACGTPIAVCTHGRWQFGGNPASPACPDSPPASESACPKCWPETQTCRYGSVDCTAPDASANRTVASCPNGTWVLAFTPCADASTDVQGDGGAQKD